MPFTAGARTAAVAELAAAEQGCCAFFGFRLHPDGPDLHLEVRAPAEGAGPLAQLFAEAGRPTPRPTAARQAPAW